MPLQNRVDPFGEIHAVQARGMLTGNRGVIHDPATRTLTRRRWTTKAWIACACEFRGRKREPMGRNAPSGGAGWTELFFLDEVTALAAGHRPCFTCRRDDAIRFAACFASGLRRERMTAPEMDMMLHGQRLAAGNPAPTLSDMSALPDGAIFATGEAAFSRRQGALLRWSFEGWTHAEGQAAAASARLVTPPAIVAALSAGYAPAWHPTAAAVRRP